MKIMDMIKLSNEEQMQHYGCVVRFARKTLFDKGWVFFLGQDIRDVDEVIKNKEG